MKLKHFWGFIKNPFYDGKTYLGKPRNDVFQMAERINLTKKKKAYDMARKLNTGNYKFSIFGNLKKIR